MGKKKGPWRWVEIGARGRTLGVLRGTELAKTIALEKLSAG